MTKWYINEETNSIQSEVMKGDEKDIANFIKKMELMLPNAWIISGRLPGSSFSITCTKISDSEKFTDFVKSFQDQFRNDEIVYKGNIDKKESENNLGEPLSLKLNWIWDGETLKSEPMPMDGEMKKLRDEIEERMGRSFDKVSYYVSDAAGCSGIKIRDISPLIAKLVLVIPEDKISGKYEPGRTH